MKKFILLTTIIFMSLIAISMVYFKIGIKHGIELEYFTMTEEDKILIKENSEWIDFEIKGINMDSGKPGVFPGESKVDKEEYLRWFGYIQDMNVNLIRVTDLMPESFYEALSEFNSNKGNPLYILQGIYFDEELLKNGYDTLNTDIIDDFKEHIKFVVDSNHGNGELLNGYNEDISKYIIGYTLGVEWAAQDLIYSEIMNEVESYNGKYFYSDKDASSFEKYLCSIGDFLVEYESDIYNKQSLISFIGSYDYHIASSATKDVNGEKYKGVMKNYIDIENIKTTDNLKTGLFVSYNISPVFSELLRFEGDIKGYLNEISSYNTIPIVISEYGVPSSRVAADFDIGNDSGYITEEEQGLLLRNTYNAIKESGCAGSIILGLQDTWYRSAWNTKERVSLENSHYWMDAQTYSQSFGLLAFDPGNKESICYPDGSKEEWTSEDIVGKTDGLELSMKSDEKYMYFMIDIKDGFNPVNQEIYIDLDITPKSGSKISSEYELNFNRDTDFIIKIDENDNSKVLVHEYYNTHGFFEQRKQLQIRPDKINNTKNMDKFSNILLYTNPKIYMESEGIFSEQQSYETGKLIYGNGNPKSKEFNSISDFYIGEDYVEVRIPWGLVNFMDPTTKEIQDDFYDTFKIKPIEVDGIYAGVTLKNNGEIINRIDSDSYKLKDLEGPNYHERLKESYYIMKDAFSE